MRKFLEKLLGQKEARKAELGGLADKATTLEELRSINSELEGINAEITELRSELAKTPEVPAGGNTPPTEGRSQTPLTTGNFAQGQVMSSYGMQQPQQRSGEQTDPFSTMEYRNAFMAFAKTGEIRPELRANATTTTADVSAVIPTTILAEVVKKLKVYGQIFKGVRQLNIKGGVEVPILTLKPTATWIGEDKSSDRQKVQAKEKVSFSYYGLECKVAISLLADTTTLDGFETTITDLIVEAMIQAIDLAVVRGDGAGKPKGIIKDTRVPENQIVTLTDVEFTSWVAWKKKVLARLPLAYKAGATFLMSSGTFEGYIDGMTDDNGQPIGRTNYGITDGPQGRFSGKEVIEVEDDVLPFYDDAQAGDVVAILCNLKNYGFNSNLEMTMFRYFDHDANEWVDKAVLIADGKLIDPNGVVIVKKAATT
ncbi:phage major capsid protein [Paenibacillus chibensis]|uniref:phage major capsid protein n=1 Tax=Paenibacillus chibensis TaxID=59846 RepID=UPI000FD738E4|nr:phage major capsid protein [Paenibacillus chibensis]MEC0370879.1 phage major capsid protein [Paenibacillus chibensis]